MFERFTKPARRVVEESARIASGNGAGEVRPEHLLAALLAEEGSLAVGVLGDLGSPAEQVRAALAQERGRYVDGLDESDAEALRVFGIDLHEVVSRIDDSLGTLPGRRRRPRFSRAGKKALELSLREALALRHNYIGTEHLLLGLVRCDDRIVSDTMRAVGIAREPLRQAVAEAVRQAG